MAWRVIAGLITATAAITCLLQEGRRKYLGQPPSIFVRFLRWVLGLLYVLLCCVWSGITCCCRRTKQHLSGRTTPESEADTLFEMRVEGNRLANLTRELRGLGLTAETAEEALAQRTPACGTRSHDSERAPPYRAVYQRRKENARRNLLLQMDNPDPRDLRLMPPNRRGDQTPMK